MLLCNFKGNPGEVLCGGEESKLIKWRWGRLNSFQLTRKRKYFHSFLDFLFCQDKNNVKIKVCIAIVQTKMLRNVYPHHLTFNFFFFF